MTNYENDSNEPKERAPLQADIYGVKFPVVGSPTADAADRITLRSLIDNVWQSTLRVVRDSFGFVADVFTAGRSLLRGVAALPAAINTRVSGAHKVAEIREVTAQHKQLQMTKDEAAEALQCTLQRLSLNGTTPKITQLPSGQIVIALLRPELEDVIEELAESVIQDQITLPPAEDSAQLEFEEYRSIDIDLLLSGLLAQDQIAILYDHGVRTLENVVGKSVAELQEFGITDYSIEKMAGFLKQFGLVIRLGTHDWARVNKNLPNDQTELGSKLELRISDSDFSVQVRQALTRLGLKTIRDVARVSIEVLYRQEGIGSSGLEEIRRKLAQFDIALTRSFDYDIEPDDVSESAGQESVELLDRPVADLNFSVGARKILIRLGVNTIGELTKVSAEDLTNTDAYGSIVALEVLREVRFKLSKLGLKLARE